MEFSYVPIKTEKIETANRRIVTDIPSPDSISILERCVKYEPPSMNNQIPIVWDRAKGFNVYDLSGNKWIDFTSTIFVANVGHSNDRVKSAIQNMLDQDLLNAYYYPTKIKADFCEFMIENACGPEFEKILLLSTGSEANEAALKMSRIWKRGISPESKSIVISFENSYHGKTLGSQMAGGKPKEKKWIIEEIKSNYHLPFPYPWVLEEMGMDGAEFFRKSIDELIRDNGLEESDIACMIMEPYQGWCAVFIPEDYAKEMKKFCVDNRCLIISDEVQSGFGRTGKMFAYEHLGIVPDIIVCGKGISSSLPLSAVITSSEISSVDQSFNSTHGGNPVAVAASLESVRVLMDEDLIGNSERLGITLERELFKWRDECPYLVSDIYCKGLLASVFLKSPLDDISDSEFVDMVIEEATRMGVMSIRTASGTLKIGPPLCITEDALLEGISVLMESSERIRLRILGK